MTDHLVELKQNIISSKIFKEIKKEQILSQISDNDHIILIKDIFIIKGKRSFFKGEQKKISKDELNDFFTEKLRPDLSKNYIIVTNNKEVYTINEDGIINEYTINEGYVAN